MFGQLRFRPSHLQSCRVFYERRWFQALAVLAAGLLVWFGLSLRVRHVSRDIKIRAEERANERIQIARDQIILEGRNRVNRLRSEDLTDAELKSLIEGVAANLNGAGGVEFAWERTGGGDSLRPDVADEVFNIAREALTNAFRHSEASRIVVELDYDKSKFRMSCHDYGRGFDAGALQANGKNGHWGLRGMEERAEKIGAEFSCKSAADKGTEVSVLLPARRAYVGTTFRLFSRRREG